MSDSPKIQTDNVLIPIIENNLPISIAEGHITVPENTGDLQVIRDENGKFVGGTSPNPKGRPLGSKNRLSELLVKTLVDDFVMYGADALAKLRQEDVISYFKLVASIAPKSLIQKYEEASGIDYAQLTNEDAVQLLDEIQRRRTIEKAIEHVSK